MYGFADKSLKRNWKRTGSNRTTSHMTRAEVRGNIHVSVLAVDPRSRKESKPRLPSPCLILSPLLSPLSASP